VCVVERERERAGVCLRCVSAHATHHDCLYDARTHVEGERQTGKRGREEWIEINRDYESKQARK